MADEKQSYQKVMKATSLFGGVQVLQILIAIARGKVLAMLLGPEGTGISNLLIRPLQLITAATNLGLDQSAVKEISRKYAEGNEDATSRTIAILKQLVWVTATVGAVVMAMFSPLLSEITFNSQAYTWSFVWLGLALAFNQLAMSRIAILQGLRK
ncbi:MAG: O-antigen/teichoic acid export membrane protein, partial [Gammaproteobacteria bacterium]